MGEREKKIIALALVFDLTVALDRFCKIIFMTNPALRGKFFFGGLVQTVEHRNYGIVANIPLPFTGILIATFAAIALIGIGLFHAWREKSARMALPLILVLGGAIGNLWDRIQYGYVYDWLLLFGRSAINVADAAIFIGIILYVIGTRYVPGTLST